MSAGTDHRGNEASSVVCALQTRGPQAVYVASAATRKCLSDDVLKRTSMSPHAAKLMVAWERARSHRTAPREKMGKEGIGTVKHFMAVIILVDALLRYKTLQRPSQYFPERFLQ
jgi:hypothetical protein